MDLRSCCGSAGVRKTDYGCAAGAGVARPLERLSAKMAIVGDESDLRERMRQGMSRAVRRLGGARQVSGTSLVALLCASALAPVVAAGVVVGPVLLAGLGVVGAVGAG